MLNEIWIPKIARIGRSIRDIARRMALERSLRCAIDLGELHLVWQPIVDGVTSNIIGAEALLRWNCKRLGAISPAEFIPVAEDTGLIVPIGDWVIDQACRQVAEWRRTLAPDLFVSVNLSPVQVRHELIDAIKSCLRRENLPASALELELTERLPLRGNCAEIAVLSQLVAAGITIAVDDYGTGHASLSYLRRFPVQSIKLDRSFVVDLPKSRDSSQIVRALVSMAHSIGMIATAEGVETQEQSTFLRSLGYDRQQGFFHGRPVSDAEYASLLERQNRETAYRRYQA